MFKFKYEKILKLKEENEENAKLELSKAIKLKQDLDFQKENLENRFIDFNLQIKEKMAKGVKSFELIALQGNKKWFKDKLLELENDINKAIDLIKKKREDLTIAVQEKKKYEVLKNNSYMKYIEKEKKEEERVIEEIISFSSAKK